ncbi:MAG TPA: pyridoxal phosphate-dependent aminotransferase, partial [Candidatus Manganitrophaceae bacterium]|nr:pyridoxal phosphate-dependent aminotransferase [Candidatus Manganitrophaceae bacterium]
ERDLLLSRGEKVTDLVSGNVHHHGIHYPQAILEQALRDAAGLARIYRPDPLGQAAARDAISRYYREEGLSVSPGQIVLAPGTSLSYWYAFKLFAGPGDEILSPRPTYPLFDAIASLAGVRMADYRLREGSRWEIDFEHLESRITERTRAIVLISPHNPTGAVAGEAELARLAEVAARRQLPIISDEVFSPFLFRRERLPRPAATAAPLVLTLNGFSKMLALPGMKIGWIAFSGEAPLVRKALAAAETISDTFLPVNETAQFAVPALLEGAKEFRSEYRSAVQERARLAAGLLSRSDRISFIPPEGGFYMTIRMNDPKIDEEALALDLLRRERLLLHPGFFYDLEPAHLVLSFVSEPVSLNESLEKLIAYFHTAAPA